MAENKKCELHDLRLSTIEKELEKAINQIENIKERVAYNENQHAKLQQIISNFDIRFNAIEGTLNDVVQELKKIGNAVTEIKTRSDTNDEYIKEKLQSNISNMGFKQHIKNNKAMYAIIASLISIISYLIKAG